MDKNNILDRLDLFYEFENRVNLTDFVITDRNLPMWMFVRGILASQTVRTAVYQTSYKWHKAFEHDKVVELGERNPFNGSQKDILFAFFNNQQIRKAENGRWIEDRYYPYISAFSEKTMTLVPFIRWDDNGFNCGYPNWYSDYALNLDIKKRPVADIVVKKIKLFIDYLIDDYPFIINGNLGRWLVRHLYDAQVSFDARIDVYDKLLEIINPKVVIIELACQLGLEKAAMAIACREKGITTAEIMYTIITKDIHSYNYERSILDNALCRSMFVDYLLTKGNYWNDKGSIPCRRYTIGDKYGRCNSNKQDENNILFLVVYINDEILGFIKNLLYYIRELPYKLYFRCHPGDVEYTLPLVAEYMNYEQFISADEMPLTYYFELCSSCIVSGPSTTIYEALCSGLEVYQMKTGFGLDDQYNDIEDVVKFSGIDDFKDKWACHHGKKPGTYNDIYDPNWFENLERFYRMLKII